MGYGDTLMSIGEAKRLHQQTKQLVMIVGRDGRPVKSDLFNGIPYLIHRPTAAVSYRRLVNGSGIRPYIAGKTIDKWTWRHYKPVPADVVFTPTELAFAEPYRDMIMLEPHVKPIGHSNKAWLLLNWLQLANSLKKEKLVQCVSDHTVRTLPSHVLKVVTPTFRHALAVLSVCRAFVGTEGGLMHGAAAVGTPTVILWSEFISPDVTGYDMHRNLRHAGEACGRRTDCKTCAESMLAITVDEVLANLKEILK